MPDGENWWDDADDGMGQMLQTPRRVVSPPIPAIPQVQQLPAKEPDPIPEWALDSLPSGSLIGPAETLGRHTRDQQVSDAEGFANQIATEIKELREKETGWAARTWRGAKRLPVLGGFLNAGSLKDVYDASERYNQGQFWKSDAKVIAAYMAEAERYGDLGVWDKALEIVYDIPGYAIEIGWTGGTMAAGRQLVRKVGTEVAEKMVKRGVLTLGTGAVGGAAARGAQLATRGVGEAVGLAVGGAAMAARSPWLVAEQVTQYAVQNSLKGENEAFAKALWQGPLSASITLASEFAGGSTAAMLAKLPGIRKLKNFVTTNWLSADKTRTLAGFARLKDRIGWHGIIGEIEEERWDEMLHGLTGLTDDYGAIQGIFSDDEARQTEAWKQIGSETIAFTGIGLPFTVASAAQYRRAGMTARKALEKFAQSDNPSRGQYNALSEGIRAHMPVEGTPIAVEVGEETVTEPFDPGKKHHRRAVRKNAQQILDQWDAMAASKSQEEKDRMVLEAEAILEATEDVATQRGAMGAYVDRLLKTRDPETGQLDGEAMLRDGISLEELRLRRIEVAGVPTNADRTAEELTREYPEAAGALIQSEETVTAELFEKLTGIPNASEEKIGEFGQQVQDIIGAQLMESLTKIETAEQQLSATATPAADAPAVVQPGDPNAIRSAQQQEQESQAALDAARKRGIHEGAEIEFSRDVQDVGGGLGWRKPVKETEEGSGRIVGQAQDQRSGRPIEGAWRVETETGEVIVLSEEQMTPKEAAAEPGAEETAEEHAGRQLTKDDLTAIGLMTSDEAREVEERLEDFVKHGFLTPNFAIPGLVARIASDEATIADREELRRLAKAVPRWGKVMIDKIKAPAAVPAAEPGAEEEEEFLVLPARSGAEMSPEQVQESLSLHDKYQNSGNESVDTKEEAIALARELKAMGFEPALELGHDLQTGKDVWHVRIKGPPSLKGKARTRATVAAAVARLRETGDNSYADQYKIEQEAIMGPAWSKLDAHEKEGAAEPGAEAAAEPVAAVPSVEPGAAAAGKFGPVEGFDVSPAAHDAYAQHFQFAIALPELLELAQRLAEGEDVVRVEGKLDRKDIAGQFRGKTVKRAAHILMNPKYAANPKEAAIILGHEIGHLIDYLPHGTLKTGNILGRVAGLRKYLKHALAGKIGGQEPMTDREKRKVKRDVRKELGEDADSYEDFNEAVSEEAKKRIAEENKSRGVVPENELRAELIGLSEWWIPYQKDEETDEGKKYIAYRNSHVELMAQALSVLLVAPKELQERAPIFWELFGNYISRHPQFLKEYQELQDLLAGDSAELMKHRERRILDNYASGSEALIAAAAARDAARIDGWDAIVRAITQGILDRTAPGKKLGDDGRKILLGKLHKKGTPTDAEMLAINKQVETLKATLDELFTADAPAHAMVLKNQREVIEPLQRAGITLDDFGLYMEMRRDIMERGEIYNPGGHTPETAAEQLNHLHTRLADEIEDPDNPGERISQFDYLERMARVFHSDIIDPMVQEAVKAGVYSQAAYKSKIEPNVQNYATFLVIRHILSDEISPMIHDQTGTFEAIANPAVATLLKMVKLSRMTVLNRAKTALVDWMNEHFREEIKPIPLPMRSDRETGRTRPDWDALPKPNPGKAHLVVLVDGQSKVYEVDEYLSKVFLNADLGFLEGVTRVMNSVLYRTFHPLFVTYNPSFVAGNWLRDIQRTQRNLGAQGRRLEFETYVAELQAIRDTEGREPTDAEKQTAKKKASKMRMGLLDILKERHKLMGWGKVAEFLSFGKLQPGAARQFARGEKVELVEQMMAEHAYAVPLTDIESQVGGLLPGFVKEQLSPTERVAEQVKKLKDLEDPRMRDKFMRTVLPAVGRLWQAFELLGAERLARYGAAQELAGKMTGYNLLAERQVPVRERAMITRKDVGTPDFMQRGLVSSITNSLFMYSKVRWSALLRDWQLLKGDMPKTRAAWVTHQIIWTLMPTTVTKLAGYGMLASLIPGGDEPEEWYTMFSKYFLDNYDVIPLGYTEVAGKQHAVGLTIPRDEMRSFVAQMWGNAMDATLESMTDVETQAGTAPKAFQELADALRTNVLPNINPYLDIAGTWMAYSQGMNPRDRFYKGDVIPRSNWEAGGWESNRKMLAWTFKKTGVLNTALHPIAGPILGDAFDDAQESWKTTTLRSTPMLQRFLRVSQRGVQDRRWAAMQEERGDNARFRLQLPTTVRKANGEQYLLSHTQHLLDDEEKQKLLVLNKWRSMTYMPAREKMLEASSAGDEQTFNQLRDQLSQVTQEIMAAPISETPPLYLGAVAWSLTDPSFEKPGESSELELLKVNRIDLSAVESLIKSEALRRNNQEIQRRSKRIGREIRTRQFPKYTRALSQRIARARDIFSGREPRRRRIGRAGMRR